MGKSFAIRRSFFCKWKSVYVVFVKFRESLYSLNQIDIFYSSTLISLNSLLIVL